MSYCTRTGDVIATRRTPAVDPRTFSDELQAIAANGFNLTDGAGSDAYGEAYRTLGDACDRVTVAYLRKVEDAGLCTRSTARNTNTRYIVTTILDREVRAQRRNRR